MDRSPTPPPPPPPPPTTPPQPPKESLARGYKFVWRILLISNLALGAYIFTRPRKKESVKKDKKKPTEIHSDPEIKIIPDSEGAVTTLNPKPYDPENRPSPIPENQWSKPFKW